MTTSTATPASTYSRQIAETNSKSQSSRWEATLALLGRKIAPFLLLRATARKRDRSSRRSANYFNQET